MSHGKAATSMWRFGYTRDRPLPHTDGRAGGKGEEGSPIIDDVCRRHCAVRRQRSGHDGVLGYVKESFRREGNASQSTEDPVRGFSFEQNAQGNRPQVMFLGEEVESVTHFKYLETSITEEGGMETEIAKRVESACGNWKRCSAGCAIIGRK